MFEYLNLVITKAVTFIKYHRHGGSNHLSSVESIKIEKERGVLHIKLFQLVKLVNFNIYIYSILKELCKILPKSSVYK